MTPIILGSISGRHQSSHTTRIKPKLPRTRRPRESNLGTIPFYSRRVATLISGACRLIVFPGLLITLMILALTLITLNLG